MKQGAPGVVNAQTVLRENVAIVKPNTQLVL